MSGVTIVAISRKRRRPTRYARDGQPPAFVIGQAQAPAAQLAAEDPVFFDQIGDASRSRRSSQPVTTISSSWKARGVDHGPELISRPRLEGVG